MTPEGLARELDPVLKAVGPELGRQYLESAPGMVEEVNRVLEARPELPSLLGGNTLEMMRANHRHHAVYMGSVFELPSGLAFVRTVLWVYRTYLAHGFSPDYFPLELSAWRRAAERQLPPKATAPIVAVYRLMENSHRDFLELSRQPDPAQEVSGPAASLVKTYVESLLAPSVQRAVDLTASHLSDIQSLAYWWQEVITPAMHKVGRLWEEGSISVGQEHLATSITQRVVSIFYPMILKLPRDKGVVVFSVTPGELHELGPRLAADLLEVNGWDVHFTGADTPARGLISLLRDQGARFLCLSTTVPLHLGEVKSLVAQVRQAGLDPLPKILVGGQAYSFDPLLAQDVGADAHASTPQEALGLLAAWS